MLIPTIFPFSHFAFAAASGGSKRKMGEPKEHSAGTASIQSALHRGEPGGGGSIASGTNPRLPPSRSRHKTAGFAQARPALGRLQAAWDKQGPRSSGDELAEIKS
jgi:hypothetical protein